MRAGCPALLFGALVAALSACGSDTPEPPREPRLVLQGTSFERLEGWRSDDQSPALDAFLRSCRVLERRPDRESFGSSAAMAPAMGQVGDWRPVCRAAAELPMPIGAASARAFFERWFVPLTLTDDDRETGLFTGYYEPLLHGARRYGGRYTMPLYKLPDDLVEIDLARFDPDLAGRRLAGRVVGGEVVPYHSRAEIDAGVLEARGLELLWVDDPVDTFFLQVQGSGQVQLEDGRRIRVGYAGQNGHGYRAIGRDLIELGELRPEEVSMQSIRTWLTANPERAPWLMAQNPSYVFFKEQMGLEPDDGPLGAQGVPLIAGRSLAVDRRYIPLGAPVWLETQAPWPEGEAPFRHLMVAQDTGGAIRGIVRGDVFFGAGERAADVAGRMKHSGRLSLLLPRSLAPTS